MCLSHSQPCHGHCAFKFTYPTCDGHCSGDTRQEGTWLCDGVCQNKTSACQNTCPTGLFHDCRTNSCSANVHSITSYLCQGDCISRARSCNGNCYEPEAMPGVKYPPYQSHPCPGYPDRCFMQESVCRNFDEARASGMLCPDMSEHSLEVCTMDAPVQEGWCKTNEVVYYALEALQTRIDKSAPMLIQLLLYKFALIND